MRKMITDNKKITAIKIGAALTAGVILLTSCSGLKVDFSESAGVARVRISHRDKEQTDAGNENENPGGESELTGDITPDTKPSEDDNTQSSSSSGNPNKPGQVTVDTSDGWTIKTAGRTYTLEPRDTSGMATMDEMYSTPNELFADAAEEGDWYPGLTKYNPATGDVTYVWDRYQSTQDAIKKYHAIYRGDETQKVCYFTFDCGYEYGPTTQILDVLKAKGVSGTFFVTGQYVNESSDIIRRMLDEGHIVGNHTKNHKRLTEQPLETVISELNDLEDLYKEKLGDNVQPLRYFRPPYGNCNEWLLKILDKMGYTTVMWSWTYKDYDVDNQLPVYDALAQAESGLHNGAVYLFHTESQTNADMLGDLIDWIRGEGYEILPLCDYKA